jgi:hypothetical protein
MPTIERDTVNSADPNQDDYKKLDYIIRYIETNDLVDVKLDDTKKIEHL